MKRPSRRTTFQTLTTLLPALLLLRVWPPVPVPAVRQGLVGRRLLLLLLLLVPQLLRRL